ncbi:C-5 cytosine-specific DNA methyltransferase [Metamycoplasma alkalescens 14918]|uniref:C-5 cytosine-specific DNA methyltransferase n=1 Tax=Metamycoplasma alkalescens 14918 TaxID=1188234 RepID=N9SQI3_9BACT|nr:DNA cytosine methyltransferase [Metamycoplasma alkalescens]ENY53629.1 C-5 cytosine-specific DNA methyltransferase [Metamycoplasma alkalescens 14918]
MQKELVVWLLFDDASCSYKNTILNNQELFKSFQNIKVYGFGMNSFEQTKQIKNNIVYEYKQIDLSLTNKDLISTLATLPNPDIILASPPCESFSIADNICRMSQDYSNTNWIVLNRKWYQTRAKDLTIQNRVRDFVKKEKNRLNGESTAGACVHIIETFQPKYWVIENPRTSKLWDFQEQHWNFYGIKTPTK